VLGSPVLRQVARPVDPDTEGPLVKDVVADLERIQEEEEGLGLAAPQIGEGLRIFLLESSSLPVLCGHRIFVNPVLSPSGPPCRREEGCLSVPGVFEDVIRPSHLLVTALDADLVPFEMALDGMAARVAQHENDHLDGILFVDRLGSLRRRLLRGRLAEISRGAGEARECRT